MQSYLVSENSLSPLSGESVIQPKNRNGQKTLVAALILTSLVDAFSILVIYLLMSTTTATETMNLEKEITLPMATQSDMLQAGVVITALKSSYKISEEEIKAEELAPKLKALQEQLNSEGDRRSGKLVIQADKMVNFEVLNPIIVAGTQSGFETIKFAVLPEKGSVQ